MIITESNKMTAEKAIVILSKQGITVNMEEAIAVLDFMHLLADIYLLDESAI